MRREVELLAELRAARVQIWSKGGGRLGFSFPKDSGFPEPLKQRAREAKAELLEILEHNGIDSEQAAHKVVYHRLPAGLGERVLWSIQKGMYLQSKIDELRYTYTIPLFVRLDGADADAAERAVQTLIATEPIFRMSVREDLGYDLLPADSFHIGRSSLDPAELDELRDQRARIAFPLPDGRILLPEVVELTNGSGVVVGLTHHHLISDAYSMEIIAERLASLYGGKDERPEALTYFDYVAHEQVQLRQLGYTEARDRLAARLAAAEKLDLGRSPVRGTDNRAETISHELGPQVRRRLVELAAEHQVSLYSILLIGLYHVLSTFTGGQSGFAVGITVANRPEEFESAIGPFINTLPVIPDYRPGDRYLDNARRVNEAVVELNQHHHLNLDMLAEFTPDLADLVQVLFTMHNFESVRGGAQRLLPYRDLAEKFGISLIAKPEPDRLSFTLTYASQRYDSHYVCTLFDTYLTFLDALAGTTLDEVTDRIDLVSAEDLRKIERGNRTEFAYDGGRNAVEMFQRQVERTPDHPAVRYRDRQLTYRKLDQCANQVANLLRGEHGVSIGSLVCLLLDRSEHMLIAILGVLKAGCAYVPVDPELPAERIRFILADTASPMLLTEARHATDWPVPMVALDTAGDLLDGQPATAPEVSITESDLAYVIYTSGTTGKPKGVLCEHGGLVNRIQWMNKQHPLREADRVLQKTPYVFDVSVWELLWANWFGAMIVFAEPDGHRDPEYLMRLVERERITVMHFVPSMLSVFLESLRPKALRSLRYLFCSGEELKLAQVRGVHAQLPWVQLHNLYGPTEASIDALAFDCTDTELTAERIGTPIDNMRAHVLNAARKPVPMHAIGELYLAGVGLARGYLNRPELTAERFVDSPFGDGRLYRTGDLVRRLPDGTIEFIGRNDFQVKIHGYRIELGEVEAALQGQPGVRQAVVLARKALVGYYVSEQPLDEQKLLGALHAQLPTYLVPSALVHLTTLPVTVNGKVDRKALPEPGRSTASEKHVPPRDEREVRLRDLWANSLGLRPEELDIRDDLTRLGMDSIVAIQLTSRLRQQLDLTVSVRDVFTHRTIERFYDYVSTQSDPQVRAEQGQLDGEVGLLPIQSWFFEQHFTRPAHWNQAFLVRTPELSLPRLDGALRELFAHHDAFRLRFSNGVQHYDLAALFPGITVLDVRSLPGKEGSPEFAEALERTLTGWQRGFDLRHGPLSGFGYLHGYPDGSSRVFFALHHLIVDTVSWRILADDLRACYERTGLGEKGSSYRQWVEAVHAHADEQLVSYWDDQLADLRADLTTSKQLCQESFTLDERQTQQLLGECHRAYRTSTEDLLLTALYQALRSTTGRAVQHIMLEGHGRENIDPELDVTRTLGWFTTLYPMRLTGSEDLGTSLCQIKEALRAVPGRGISFGPLIGYRGRALPKVWFNYLGQLDRGSRDWEVLVDGCGDTMPADNVSDAALTVFSYVAEGRLEVHVDSRIDAEITAAVARELRRALSALIDHCVQAPTAQSTASDFRHVRTEADLLDLPPVLGVDPYGWFDMTEIQRAYLLGRLGTYEIGNVANHVYTEYVYPELDTDRLEAAINQLVAECAMLRTVFSSERLQQRVLDPAEVSHYRLQVHQFGCYDEELLADVRDQLSHQLHDPERFPLFTFAVSRFADRCVLHSSVDLIMLDVRSRLSVLRRLDELYRGEPRREPLPAASFKDYQDYIGLLRNSAWYEEDRAYWQRKLAIMPLRCTLPFRAAPEAIVHPRFDEHTLYVDDQVWRRFKQQAGWRGLSASSVLLSLFGSVLGHFSGSTEFPITVTLFNRYGIVPGSDEILGNFTSTVLYHFVDHADAEQLTRCTHDELWADVSHALYSGVQVQRDLSRLHGLDTSKAVSPLVFTGVVGNETRDFERTAHLDDSEFVERRYWNAQTSQAWIDLQAVEVDNGFASKWLYVEQLFDRTDIAHLNRVFCLLIEHLANGDWQLPRECYLPEADFVLIRAANDYRRPVSERTLFGLYEDWVCGRVTAVIDAGGAYSYEVLGEQSTGLARLLYARAAGQELVSVLAEKGYLQVLATSAIMKAGMAYVPMNIEWPLARIGEVLAQAGVQTLLVSRAQYERVQALAGKLCLMVMEEVLSALPPEGALPEVTPDDTAYVIFTSGSTGKPKGVTISHRGAVNTILAVNERFGVRSKDRVLAVSELSFDLSVYDIFGMLAAGGTIVFPSQEDTKDPAHWLELVHRHGVTIWNSVPQLASLLLEQTGPDTTALNSLRVFLLSGDWIPTSLPDKIHALNPEATVMSLGGATEGSIWSIWYEVDKVDPAWPSIPYGVAMPNQGMYVLSTQGEHCPIGVTGEIHIGGIGVALNYWRDDNLTTTRFFPHPTLGRLYRTGDLGRWSRAGYLEFLGRNDSQIKLNGYRIELGEIESTLTQLPGINQAVVLIRDQRLVGYYVADTALDTAQLQEFLGERVPKYMVPEVLVHLTELPLSANGKLDRAALPEPELTEAQGYLAPRSTDEATLRDVWADVLGVPAHQLGIRDDLLRLGMDSIVAIRLVSRMRKDLGLVVGVREVFAHRTIERFFDEVARNAAPKAVAVRAEQGVISGDVPLLPIQSWFFAQDFPRPQHWNQSFLVRTPELDPARLEEGLRALVAHHDAFRLRYRPDGTQNYEPAAEFPDLRVLDVQGMDPAEVQRTLTAWQAGFDLAHGPLSCFGYLHGYADGSARVFFAVHHLAVDIVSWRILAEDLRAAYEGTPLGDKATSYRQWADVLAEPADERAYWQGVLADWQDAPLLTRQGPATEVEIGFDRELTGRLLRDGQRLVGNTVTEFLLTAFGHAVSRMTERSTLHLMLEGHGREELAEDVDITRTVGWFTSLFPARIELGADLVASLKSVKESLRTIPAKGVHYGTLLGYDRPLPVICFNYLGQFENSDDEYWQITGERGGEALHPDNKLPYALNLAGMVMDGQLRFRLTSRLSEQDTAWLVGEFRSCLDELVKLAADSLRTYLTSSDIDHLLSQAHLDRLQADMELDGVYAASSLQQGFISHALRQGEVDEAYRVQTMLGYHTELDPERLREAWARAQQAFSSLRAHFDWQYELVQVVPSSASLHWQFLDLSGQSPQEQERAFTELCERDRRTPYDLTVGGLFRVYLVKFGERAYTCLLNTHHAILDGWSSPLLVETVHAVYRGELPPAEENYAEIARYLHRNARQHDEFWREYVSGIEDSCDLSGLLRTTQRHIDLGSYQHIQRQGQRSITVDAGVREFAQANGLTLNAVLQYAWHKLLSVYGHSSTTVVGTVLSGRDIPVDGIDRSIGLYLSTVPLIARHTTGSIEDIQALQRDIHEINRRSTVDLAALQPGGRRLFDSLFIYENYPVLAEDEREPRAQFRSRYQKRDYPLVVTITEWPGDVRFTLDYAEELFDPATIERLLAGIESLFGQLVTRSPLSLVGEADLALQLQWNNTGTVTPAEPVIHRAFEVVAADTPSAPAIEHNGQVLSYGEVNAAANQLARYARSALDPHGEPVLLLLDRSEHTLISIFAVLKLGAAYVPLDPSYPDNRIARIVASSGARLVLTQQRHQERFRHTGLTVIAVDDLRITSEPGDNLGLEVDGKNPAYVLYTSGSTGEPKGVVVQHAAYTSTVQAMRERYFTGYGPLRTFSVTNYVFDIFGLEYGLTLFGGGSIVLADHLFEDLDCAGYDFLQLTPSLLGMKLSALRGGERTRLLVGGEALDRHLLSAALPRFEHIVNVYGPTETTIWSTARTYRGALAEGEPVTIGVPLPGEGAHILDEGLSPLPIGAIGELYLSGCGLAHGYVNDPELTAQRFIDSPSGDGRLYRTGDLARWLPTGEIEFVGRVDNQVKLRGHRIELGEVEHALSGFPGVRQSVARVVTTQATQYLVGYYVADKELDEQALTTHLAQVLPVHMLPSRLLWLAELPLLHSGKLDVKALPAATPERGDHVSPIGELEQALAAAWQDVLGVDRVSTHERFFDLGGNSVLLTKVYGRLPDTVRQRLRLTDLFAYPTIAALNAHLREAEEQQRPAITTRPPVGSRDIAIIGMACRLPDAEDVNEFWRNLTDGVASIRHYGRDELLAAGISEAVLDQPGYVHAQSRMRDIRSFDAEFFGYSRREAELMDPQHRVFLECAWHALEDALCDPSRYDGSIGLYAGMGHNDYMAGHVRPELGLLDLSAEYQLMINSQANFLCTKVAYRLNLTGPAVTVQTACSSSLVAVHQACVALLAGDCATALAGGVSIGQLGKQGYLHQQGMVFSPDGECRAFDARANGTVEGQGVGIVVLKPLDRALADGDPIRAVIKASAINNDGHDKVGYTAPSQRQQAAAIRTAHRRAEIDPATISYVEAHGTGTPLGDPIEFEGLRAAFGTVPAGSCALGSVKTNIGHLDVASGVAGLIKTVLCLEHRRLVPTLNYKTPNPAIEFAGSPFHVSTDCRPWTSVHGVLRAGVSSFGIGGTNAHVVVEQAPEQEVVTHEPKRAHHLLQLSARTPEALRRQAQQLAGFLSKHPDTPLDRVGYSLRVARQQFVCNRVVVGTDRQELVDRLREEDTDHIRREDGRSVVFLFPGQGSQYEGMGRALYDSEPMYRSAVDSCLCLLHPYLPEGVTDNDLLGWTDRVRDTRFTQPALFIHEYALAQWFGSLGVRPDAMIGHSLGEYVAACLAGVFTLRDALWLMLERGRLLAATAPGAMLAVPLPVEHASAYLAGAALDVAVVNDAASCVVAGDADAVRELADLLAADGVTAKQVAVSNAFHSRLLDPVLDEFRQAVAQLDLSKPDIPFVSDLTGDWVRAEEVSHPEYWMAQLRSQVSFHSALTTVLEADRYAGAVIVEVGPGRLLTRLTRKHPACGDRTAVPTMQRGQEPATLAAALGTVWAAGVEVDADAYYGLCAGDRIRLPAYPFDRTEHWIGSTRQSTPQVLEATTVDTDTPAAAVEEAWRAVLGVSQVRPHDDFFEQGGDSLAAAQFVACIQRLLNVRLEFMELTEHTPSVIAARLRSQLNAQASATTAPRSVVRIKQGDPDVLPPMVLVHPVGGDVYFYRELAQCLPEAQPVYVIRSPMLDGLAEYDTIEQMATAYLDLLAELDVHPPYRLGGSSFGGLVAYEMAQLLAKRTGYLPEVVLIDTPAHGNLPAGMDESAILHYLTRYGLGRLAVSEAELESRGGLPEKIRYLAERARGTVFEEMLAEDFLPVYLRTWRRHNEAMHSYVPAPYDGDLVFFSHTEEIPEFPAGQELRWRELARGGWRHVRAPGNHLSMNAMPNVAAIGTELGGKGR